jgi:ADP-ribose pyrophosphatase YjhB (NUDIX family)
MITSIQVVGLWADLDSVLLSPKDLTRDLGCCSIFIMKNFPFKQVSARAIILRRRDGALLGALHRKDGKYAPLGGQVEEEETPEFTLMRELGEENIRLIDSLQGWENRLTVDYHHGDGSLNIWYIFIVDDVQLGENKEVLDTRWFDQTQDVWYPGMREKICLAIKKYVPDLLSVNVIVLESW